MVAATYFNFLEIILIALWHFSTKINSIKKSVSLKHPFLHRLKRRQPINRAAYIH